MSESFDKRKLHLKEVEAMAWRCAFQESHTMGEEREAWHAGYEAMFALYRILKTPTMP
jgi:hypothetical protein